MRHFILFLSLLAALSCSSHKERTLDAIWTELEPQLQAEFNPETYPDALMNEYADSLLCQFNRSTEMTQRVNIISQANKAMMYAYGDSLIMKFDKVLTSWVVGRLEQREDAMFFQKEIVFLTHRNTDKEKLDLITISVVMGDEPETIISIPDGNAKDTLFVAIGAAAPVGSDSVIDFDGSVKPMFDDVLCDYGARNYFYYGTGLYELLLNNDRIFLAYPDETGGFESAVLALENFHRKVAENL